LIALAAAAGCAAGLDVRCAAAQSAAAGRILEPPQAQSEARAAPDLRRIDDPEPAVSSDVEGEGSPSPEQPDTDDGANEDDAGTEGTVSQTAGWPAVVRDGDLSQPREPEAPVDGAVATGEPSAPQDGADTATLDMRSADDIAVFASPPAGYDPLLFQIEDLAPELDRRPQRLYRFEPYDPVGIRIGSFVLFPEIEIGGAFTDNVLLSPGGLSDRALELRPAARLASAWSTHALELRGGADLSYHDEFTSEDDRGWEIEARGRIDMTKRANLQGLAGRSVSQESRSAIDAGAGTSRADVETTRAAASVNHRLNRLSLQLRAGVVDTEYDAAGFAGTADDRDVTATEEAVRATWELKPTLAVFGEVALDQRDHEITAVSDGIGRDSDGERYRLGLDFGATGEILRGELSLGWGRQRPHDARLDDIDGLLLDANLAWRATALTALLLTARTDFAETTTAGSGGVIVRQVGGEVRHALRRYLIASAGLSYEWRDYAGIDLDEAELRAGLGIEYFLSREVVLSARYLRTDFFSSTAAADYDTNEARLAVKLRR